MSVGPLPVVRTVGRTTRSPFDPTRLLRLVIADVLERTRRPGYLVTLLVMAWIAPHMLPPNGAGYRTFVIDDLYRPVYNAAWVGTLTALLTAMWFLFVGFYLVRGSVERDRLTGVGQILAASRLKTLTYLWSRVFVNVAVLGSQAAVVAGMALVQQQILGEDRRFDPIATLTPFFTITLPIAGFVAAAAVFFDTVRWLRGGLGNILWFFLLGLILVSGGLDDVKVPAWRDATGARALVGDVRRVMIAAHPDAASHPPSLSMGVNANPKFRGKRTITFEWTGMRWTADVVRSRLPWFLFPILIVVAAAIPFDRFDTAAPVPRRRTGSRRRDPATVAPRSFGASAARLTVAPRRFSAVGIVRAELALLLKGQSPWWFVGLLGFLIAELAAPLTAVRQVVLPLVSFWPALVWSSLGHRERRNDTGAVLFSCPHPVERLLPAAWLAGALVMLAASAPALLRFLATGQWSAVAGWLLCSAFVPALALACGVWSGSARLFEVLYLFLWYTGPMQRVAPLDYTGVAAPRTAGLWAAYLGLTLGAFALAWVGRARQVRG